MVVNTDRKWGKGTYPVIGGIGLGPLYYWGEVGGHEGLKCRNARISTFEMGVKSSKLVAEVYF